MSLLPLVTPRPCLSGRGWDRGYGLFQRGLSYFTGGLSAQAALAFEGKVGTLGMAIAQARDSALAERRSVGESGLRPAFLGT